MGKGSFKKTKVKDPWAGLENEFRDATMQSSPDEIRKRITEAALNQVALMEARKVDGDLIACRHALQAAGASYVAGTKRNRLKIEFCKATLASKGVEVPTPDAFLPKGARA
jgi:ppGpp synthetase/RelA/SpoT-type nucleotidyltranferase